MKRFVFIGFLLLLLLGTTAYGQTIRITGTVSDASDGSTLPGVSILIKGTQQGTVTDINGRYELNADGNATLVFSFIGMLTQEIPVGGRNVINVALEPEITALGEVVIIGYGTARPVGTVVGSVSTVTAEKLESKPVAKVLDVLQGQVAGMQVFTSSGEPSQTQSIRLHGRGSLTSSAAPLYVLDGVPVAQGNILSLNPNDIENVTVLKDASATSIYGSRAANGVIYITTKRGTRDERARVSVNYQSGVSSLANTDYFESFMNTEQLTGFWVETGFRTQAWVDATLEQYPHDTKWYKYFYQDNAPTSQGDVSVQGGGGRTTYYVSGSYFYQDGLAYRSAYERYSARANLQSNANDWLEIGANIGLSTDDRQTNPYAANFLDGGLGILFQPYYSPYDTLGNLVDLIPGLNRVAPHYRLDKSPSNGKNTQLNAMSYGQLNPISGLTIRTQVGLDAYDYRSIFRRMPSASFSLGNGLAYEYFSRSVTRSITNTAEYKFNLKRRNEFIVLAGQEYVDNEWEMFWAESTGHSDDRLILLGAGPDNRAVGQNKTAYAFMSYFGRLDYALDKKYYFDFSLRQDASSRFGRDNRTANFFAVGAMWDVKKEGFMRNVDFISSLRVKASTGTSGNSEIGNYQHLALVGTNIYSAGTGWHITTPGNSGLTWESQQKTTVGVNFGILSDKFRFNVEYYDRRTSAMLLDVPQPFTTGFNVIKENVGTLQNYGVDFELRADAFRTSDFFFSPYVNLNYNKDKVTDLFQDFDEWIIPATGVAWVIGKPVAYYYPLFAGIDPDDGSPMWYVPGEDRNVTTREETTKVFVEADLQQYTGIDRYPAFSGGFGFATGYKGITLSADFSFVNGKYMINNDRFFTDNPTQFPGWNQSVRVLDYWKEPGDQAAYPRYQPGLRFMQFDDRLIEDASFLRLKVLTLSYTLPSSLVQRTGFLTGTRVFVTGRNLLTFTNYLGPDPEVDSNIGMGTNPNTKQMTIGISVNF